MYGAMACVGVCGYRAMACVGVGVRCVWRWVYVWLACVYALGVCVVWCTLCISFYDVT